MGMRAATEVDLVKLEEYELEEDFKVPPSVKYDAIVRYLVSQKYHSISALCRETELTRPSVQTRILKRVELGNKVLSALAKACGVTLRDLTTLSIKELRSKIDEHLASDTSRTEIPQKSSDLSPANTYLHHIVVNHSLAIKNLVLNDQIQQKDKLEQLAFYTADVFVGCHPCYSNISSSKFPEVAPVQPSEIRMSICGILSPTEKMFDIAREHGDTHPSEENFAFLIIIVGQEEMDHSKEILEYIFETRNTLNICYPEAKPKLCLLTVYDENDGDKFEAQNRMVTKLKAVLVDAVIEVDPKKLNSDSYHYTVELLTSMIDTFHQKERG